MNQTLNTGFAELQGSLSYRVRWASTFLIKGCTCHAKNGNKSSRNHLKTLP